LSRLARGLAPQRSCEAVYVDNAGNLALDRGRDMVEIGDHAESPTLPMAGRQQAPAPRQGDIIDDSGSGKFAWRSPAAV